MAFDLPDLSYDYDALEPVIDARTMEIHHTKHHEGYRSKLNNAIEGQSDLENKSIDQLLREIDSVPEDIREAVRNNGGGYANHLLFWEVMAPNAGGSPTGEVAEAIESTFGSFDDFKSEFSNNATGRFGSGWSWLVVGDDGDLKAYSTPNQDSPYMQGHTPILGLDVWEHAYYLNYQNKRGDYVQQWWQLVNWEAVNERYREAAGQEVAG